MGEEYSIQVARGHVENGPRITDELLKFKFNAWE